MDLARLPEGTSPSIDDRLASLADPELADRLAGVHPALFGAPPLTERQVVKWTARRYGITAVAISAIASVGVGYAVATSFDRNSQAHAKVVPVLVPAPKTSSAKVTPRFVAKAPAHRAAHASVAAVAHAAPIVHAAPAPVRHAAAPVVAHVAAPVQAPAPAEVAPSIVRDSAQVAETARLRARLAEQNAEIARLRERELAQNEAARAQRIRAAQAIAAAQHAKAATTAAAPSSVVAHAPLSQNAGAASASQGAPAPSGAADPASANRSAQAQQTASTTGTPSGSTSGVGSVQNGTASGDDPTIGTQGPTSPSAPGRHHGGFGGFPFPAGGPIDSCSPQGGRLSTVLINGVLGSLLSHSNF